MGYHASWIVQILPLLDAELAYRRVEPTLSVYAPSNQEVRRYQFDVLVCPTDWHTSNAELSASVGITGLSSYAGNTGGENRPVDVDNKGIFFLNSSIGDKHIRDGLSNVLAVGERRLVEFHGQRDLGWMSGTSGTLRNCGIEINSGIPGFDSTATSFDGSDATAEAARETGIDDSNSNDLTSSGGFGSYHSAGLQVLLCDGSVRYMSESISPWVFFSIANRDDGNFIDSSF